MPWYPLPQIAFAVAIYPFHPSSPDDLPLELGDELYIIEQGGVDGSWFRGYLVAPPSLLAGLSSVKGQTLEARVFSGIFPRNCVEVREVLGEENLNIRRRDGEEEKQHEDDRPAIGSLPGTPTEYMLNGATYSGTPDRNMSPADGTKDPARYTNGIKSDPRRTTASDRLSLQPFGDASVSRSASKRKPSRQKEKRLQRGLSNRSPPSQKYQGSIPPLSSLSVPQARDPNAPKPPAPVPMLKVGDETPTSLQEPLVDEIASCLREWHSTYLHELLLAQQYGSLNSLSKLVRKLDFSRRQLLHNVLTDFELVTLRENVVWDLVNGNKLLGGDVVVRDPAQRGRILTGDDSIVNLSELQSIMSLLGERPVPQPELASPHHPPGHVNGIGEASTSTVVLEDQVIVTLTAWRDRSQEELAQLLKMVAFVPEIEIARQFRELLDVLFAILVDQNGNDEFEDLIFQAVVTVLSIVHDRRFNMSPMVDDYIRSIFKYPFVAPSLIRSFTRLLACCAESEISRRLRATFKVGHYVFDFIISARQQHREKEAGIGMTPTQPNFVRELRPIFQGLEDLMRNPAPVLVGSQTLAAQYFHHWIRVLSRVAPMRDILQMTVDFIDSCADIKGKLILFKLLLIHSCSRMSLFFDLEARRILVLNTVRWLAPYWGTTSNYNEQWRDQVRLCCSILSSQLNDLEQEQISQYLVKIVDSYHTIASAPRIKKSHFSLLFPAAHPFPSRVLREEVLFDEALIELSAILSALLGLRPDIQLSSNPAEHNDFLSNLFKVHMSILRCEAFPSTWLSLYIYHHLSSLKTLEYVARLLMSSYLPLPDDAESFNTDLWRAFFTTLLTLVASDALALERFPEQKRRAVWKIAGDVREQGAHLLRRTWDAIGWETSVDERQRYGLEKMGGFQVQYVPGLVGPVIELCMSVHEGLRVVAVRLLQTMIVSEWTLSQDLSVLQAEMIDALDQVFKSRPLTETTSQKLFITELINLFRPLPSMLADPLTSALRQLLTTADEFIDLLAAVHSVDATGEATQIMHTLRLMEFLKDMRKEDIFIRYVHQLAQIQIKARNPTGAGLALRLHADLYSWDLTKSVRAIQDPQFPEQTAFERKERLYFEMLKHYEEGKSWHLSLAAYQEVAEQYENNVFDLAKLARTQRAMANVYEAIAKGDQSTPRYFRVCFKGLGFSAALRDKEFIYEGSPLEKLSAFTDRMQKMFPSAQLISGNEPEDIEGQFMQISPVGVYRDLNHPVFQRAKVPHSIREHLLSVAAKRFTLPSRRSPLSPNLQQQTVERTIYTTAEEFPTILRRSEVIGIEEISLSPLQAALERTMRKTQELAALEQRIVKKSNQSPLALFDALNSSVDASLDASISRYWELIPTNPDEQGHSEDRHENLALDPPQNALKTALIDHAFVVKRCLSWLSSNSTPQDHDTLRDLCQSELNGETLEADED